MQVKGGLVSLVQLAEEWLLRANKFFQNPYSCDGCNSLLKEAEQFLWAGSKMDPVSFYFSSILYSHIS